MKRVERTIPVPAVHITKIDRNHNTIHFMMDGIHITAVCARQDDGEAIGNVKNILIGSYLNSPKRLDKIGQNSAKVR